MPTMCIHGNEWGECDECKLGFRVPCHAMLRVYVKKVKDDVATVFVDSGQGADHYPFTVPVNHLWITT